jgi:hypothetical protein
VEIGQITRVNWLEIQILVKNNKVTLSRVSTGVERPSRASSRNNRQWFPGHSLAQPGVCSARMGRSYRASRALSPASTGVQEYRSSGVQEHPTGKRAKILEETRAHGLGCFREAPRGADARKNFRSNQRRGGSRCCREAYGLKRVKILEATGEGRPSLLQRRSSESEIGDFAKRLFRGLSTVMHPTRFSS